MLQRPHTLLALTICLALLGACGGFAAETTPSRALPTETAPAPSSTPLPAATDTPQPALSDTPAATPTASASPSVTPDQAATAAFESTRAGEGILALAGDVLPEYGFSPDSGSLGWYAVEPVELAVQDAGTILYEAVAGSQAFGNFVLYVDISREATGGLAGCGIIFRSEADLRDGEQYMLRTLRLSGQPAWSVERWDSGQVANTLRVEPNEAIGNDPASADHFVMLMQGPTLTLYANGVRLAGLTINRRATGRIAFLAWQDSGATTCLFENAWIWELEG